jgi:hypothetical protein
MPVILTLRACDFIDFSQKPMLKTTDLCIKKSGKFKKVTNSERSRRGRTPHLAPAFAVAGPVLQYTNSHSL